MARTAGVLLSAAVLLVVLDLGACLSCYACHSVLLKKCIDPFPAAEFQHQLVECSGSEGMQLCQKIVLRDGSNYRECLSMDEYENDMCNTLKNKHQSQDIKSCNYCNTDGCNGAASIAASLSLALLAGVLSYIF